MTLIELLPFAHCGRPFSALTRAERRRWVVEHWVPGGGLGGVCAHIRLLVLMGAYGDPRNFDDIGFVPIHLRQRFSRHESARSALRHEITTAPGSAAS